MEAAQTVGAMVPVVAAGAGGDDQTAAVLAGEGLVAGMGLVVTLFVLLSFIFTVHSDLPRSIYCVFIIAKYKELSTCSSLQTYLFKCQAI
jgi:hypothetical protein